MSKRDKVVDALQRIVPWFLWWVRSSAHLSGAERDRLEKVLLGFRDDVLEAHTREHGRIPLSPGREKERQKQVAQRLQGIR